MPPTRSPSSPNSPNSPNSPSSPNPDDILLLVNPEFPPNIDPKALGVALFNKRKKSKKMLNEFFIYRKEFVKELKRLNLRPKQTRVSSLASTSWHRQESNVKDEYRRLARETERWFMAERQREANRTNDSLRTESNESSPDDTTPVTSPALSSHEPNYQTLDQPIHAVQAGYYTHVVENPVTYPIQSYIWPTSSGPYLYYNCYNNNNYNLQMPPQQVPDFFSNYGQL